MKENLTNLIQSQINWELYSAYSYYAVAEFYRAKGLSGFHAFFEKQAREEIEHAEKLSEYLQDHDIAVKLSDIKALKEEFVSLRDPLLFFVKHEKEVTALIHALYREARSEDDLETMEFLSWYVSEQGEEEKSATDLLQKYDLFGANGGLGLYELDKELAK
ncbi:MAG: ferritin [Candidatus Enteromonas sp.]|nr:ferritin [bacterium]MDD6917456.1 ferritin [bacterium]MDY6101289.1 ferritin [Candidatus Enteromonas sp.]